MSKKGRRMRVTKHKPFVWLLLFGSLWGMSEVVLGGLFDEIIVAFPSVWLNAWALFVLAIARGIIWVLGRIAV